MTESALLCKDHFLNLDGLTHLCTGGESPWLKSHDNVYTEFSRLKSSGWRGRETVLARVNETRLGIGKLWNVESDRVCFMPAAYEGMNYLARGIDWQPGDNLVTTSLEFPSVAWAWRDLVDRGVEIRFVDPVNWTMSEHDLLNAVDDRTRLLAVSQVSYYNGQNLDIRLLANGLDRNKTLLAVDSTHASGVIAVDASITDLTISSSYKWMLATTGVAACYVSERAQAQVKPTTWGWNNLRYGAPPNPASTDMFDMPQLLEPGNTALLNILFLSNGLNTIHSVGIDNISEHARSLAAEVYRGLESLGIDVISPDSSIARSGNTSFCVENSEAMMTALGQQDVLVWGDRGRIRISTHLYNDSDDVARAIEAIASVHPT